MKYEYLCGYESDFFAMPENVIAVVRLDHCVQGLTEFNQITECGKPVLAMRRIIRTPTWSVADQKAGKLPAVGAKFLYKDEELCCHYVDSNGEIWANNFKGEVVTPLLREIKPIESPEEKAARLRSEWCRKCKSQFYPGGSNGFPEMIYDALLSGELPVPVKEQP